MCVCVRVCVHACVRACVRVCVWVHADGRLLVIGRMLSRGCMGVYMLVHVVKNKQ